MVVKILDLATKHAKRMLAESHRTCRVTGQKDTNDHYI